MQSVDAVLASLKHAILWPLLRELLSGDLMTPLAQCGATAANLRDMAFRLLAEGCRRDRDFALWAVQVSLRSKGLCIYTFGVLCSVE